MLSKIRKSNSLQRSTLPVHATAQGQAFPCQRTPQAAEDATEIADWSAGIGWDVTYQQVTHGEFSGSFHASTRTGLVLHYHYAEPSVIIRGCAPPGMFALAVSEVALTPPIFQGHRLTASQVITMHPGSDAVLRSPERTGVSSVSIPADRLDQALLTYGSRPLSQLGQRAWAWDFTAGRASTIHTLIRRAISMVAEVDACTGSLAEIKKLADGLIQTIAFGLLEGTSAGPSTVARRNRTRYVRRACDYVESHLRDGINAEALANACGVSLRTLEYAFADVLNIRLHEYIKGRRLNAARHDLMRCQSLGLSVSRVALDYGFSHLSLFAKSYCNFFGELPSDTLRSHRT